VQTAKSFHFSVSFNFHGRYDSSIQLKSDRLLGCERGEVLVVGDGWHVQVNRPAGTPSGYFLERQTSTGWSGHEGTAAALRTVAESLRNGQVVPFSIEQALEGQTILLAMVCSELNKGARVYLNEVDPGFTVTGRFGDKYA